MIIPAAVIGAVAALVLSSSDKSKPSRRYRPGRPYEFPAMWLTAAPERVAAATSEHHGLVIEDSSGAPVRPGPTGGASDSW
ncbi:aa3-type cytochrome oxidase subunit CtaJ [Actinoplanes aureus]|uniref:aa3-type cytochrome oxidase subunit CtaJ n=1 Tax=Actinoplanes aureus TaxID=2792083 RepID=UPI0040385EB9